MINQRSDNGLVPSSTKTLPAPLLTQLYVIIWRHLATKSYGFSDHKLCAKKQTKQNKNYARHDSIAVHDMKKIQGSRNSRLFHTQKIVLWNFQRGYYDFI